MQDINVNYFLTIVINQSFGVCAYHVIRNMICQFDKYTQ